MKWLHVFVASKNHLQAKHHTALPKYKYTECYALVDI